MKSARRGYKQAPTECPHCGQHHEVYVEEAVDLVDVSLVGGDIAWAEDYPHSEGYRYYYKRCPETPKVELRYIGRAPA